MRRRHQRTLQRNGDPNERELFHFCPESVIAKIWQEVMRRVSLVTLCMCTLPCVMRAQGAGFDPRLSNWAEVGKGAYFSEHLMYGYAYKYKLWDGGAESAVGETMRVFVALVSLGNVADLGVGCETCPSPLWDDWKAEFSYQKSAQNPSPKPTRPPAMQLNGSSASCKHRLDLLQVGDAGTPRFDSVMSTEGDLGTAPSSCYKNNAGRPIRDVMHPRLLKDARKWGQQYVVFDASAAYPQFLLTLTKVRESPCSLPLLASQGISADELYKRGFRDVGQLLRAGFAPEDIVRAGAPLHGIISAGISPASLDVPLLLSAGCSVDCLKCVGCDIHKLAAAQVDYLSLETAGFTSTEIEAAGVAKPSPSECKRIVRLGAFDSYIQRILPCVRAQELLFDSDVHGRSNDAFHGRCDGKGATIGFVFSGSNIFGFVATQSWNVRTDVGGMTVGIEAPGCRLFSLFRDGAFDPVVFELADSGDRSAMMCNSRIGPGLGSECRRRRSLSRWSHLTCCRQRLDCSIWGIIRFTWHELSEIVSVSGRYGSAACAGPECGCYRIARSVQCRCVGCVLDPPRCWF